MIELKSSAWIGIEGRRSILKGIVCIGSLPVVWPATASEDHLCASMLIKGLNIEPGKFMILANKLKCSLTKETEQEVIKHLKCVLDACPHGENSVLNFKKTVLQEHLNGRCIEVNGVLFSYSEASLLLYMSNEGMV